jgi:hypothetical protein
MTRQAARLIWAALVATPVLFGAVAFGQARAPQAPALVAPVFWLALAAAALNVALSRLLPQRLGPAFAQDRDAVAFTRLLVAFALCDAAAMAPLVGFILTRDVRLLALGAAGVLALALLFPSDARWERLQPRAAGGAMARGVR